MMDHMDYPPRACDLERATHPTAWQRLQAERKAEAALHAQEAHEPLADQPAYGVGPEASPLNDQAKGELLRCAEAFESTAKRLREIVGE